MKEFEFEVFPKVNIFLKIGGHENGYHTLVSRLVLLKDSVKDWIAVKPSSCFSLKGNFNCPLLQNTIYKMLQVLKSYLNSDLSSRLEHLNIEVQKNIPVGAGLGGGSGDAGVLLRELNTRLELGLSLEQCYHIGAQVGSDVNFFISGFSSANVYHFGEVVEFFEESPLSIEICTPLNTACETAKVYQAFDSLPLPTEKGKLWCSMRSVNLLKSFTQSILNDLYRPATTLYPTLKEFEAGLDPQFKWFFSGSGSSFFRLKEEA
ncbi:4-(cytidine 5'-diphospho)-2-C-methyl-D-erythritol kinase [Helicobacter cynogastricus]|uniref:4-(cytidine 5'-diphospho)-2-C-methyl-D-erythritol kinase n=1 Tax=Helicobacter cynogastricus TaxID=329937 RepID=UPI000CF0660C|nr:4-(cytidine 5'-diphospho)-2-C-methyl-D-erythritol kinase [Helicobacter cynogastricus]